MNDSVVAIVVTYNRRELLQECLEAILLQTHSVENVIVINNCSTDDTERLFMPGEKYDQPIIEFYTTEKNIGGSGGFEKGFELADKTNCDWIWVMDDDAIPFPDTLEELIKARKAISEEKVGFIASAVYGMNGEPMNVPVLDRKKDANGYEDWYRYSEFGLIKIRSATFVSLLIPHEAVKELGYPIKEFFIWGDDTEYTRRLSTYYGDSYLCGKSKIIHKRANAKSLSILNEEDKYRVGMYHYYYRNSLLTAHKYNPKGNSALHVCEFHLLALKCLFKPGVNNRWIKFVTLERGIFEYLFGSVNIKSKLDRINSKV